MTASLKMLYLRKRRLARGIAIAAACLGLACIFGCLPRKRSPEAAEVIVREPVSDDQIAAARRRGKAERYVEWRGIYEKNRPEPPEKYEVFGKPPGDNAFGEFRDGNFSGLDTQPELPPLPADYPSPFGLAGNAKSAGAGMGRVEYPLPPTDSAPPRGYPAEARAYGAGGQAGAGPGGKPGRIADPYRPAAISPERGTPYYPVEQLVYGGDYPELDKPELYRLMPRDIITVTVKDHPEFSGTVEVQPDGTVRLPNSPDLPRIRGLTCEEAANALADVLSVYIRGEARVRVQANRARGGHYYVLGDVLQPGRFPMGMEPVKLSEAVLAANWEANPARRDIDGDDLGPSFPAATPRGRFIAPKTADLARVMLVTPHRSQPVRTIHDSRAALMGMTGDDPVVRPGQVIIVTSLDEARNAAMGIAPPEALSPGQGFSNANSSARLPEVTPNAPPRRSGPMEVITPRESNMTETYQTHRSTRGADLIQPAEQYGEYVEYSNSEEYCEPWLEDRAAPAARERTARKKTWGLGF